MSCATHTHFVAGCYCAAGAKRQQQQQQQQKHGPPKFRVYTNCFIYVLKTIKEATDSDVAII